ncbi:MAG: protein kinase [Desulfurococcales archaeon]|nr:protein kinase [Desulfurococcales archaeon]
MKSYGQKHNDPDIRDLESLALARLSRLIGEEAARTYLDRIKRLYCEPVYSTALLALDSEDISVDSLRDDIERWRPPVKAYLSSIDARSRYAVLHRSRIRLEWESEDLGDTVYDISWSPDGYKLAYVLGNSGRTQIMEVSSRITGEIREEYMSVLSLDWSPTGDEIAAGYRFVDRMGDYHGFVASYSEDAYRLWSSPDLRGWVMRLRWSPDGSRLAVGLGRGGSKGERNGRVVMVDRGGGIRWTTAFYNGWVRDVSWSPDGSRIAAVAEKGLLTFLDDSGRVVREFQGFRGVWYSVSWSPEGDLIAVGTGWKDSSEGGHGEVLVYNLRGDKVWESPDLQGAVTAVSWSPDGRLLAAGTAESRRLYVLDREGSLLWVSPELGGLVWSVAWSPAGSTVAVGGFSRRVTLFGGFQDSIEITGRRPECDLKISCGGFWECLAWATFLVDHKIYVDGLMTAIWRVYFDGLSLLAATGVGGLLGLKPDAVLELIYDWAVSVGPDNVRDSLKKIESTLDHVMKLDVTGLRSLSRFLKRVLTISRDWKILEEFPIVVSEWEEARKDPRGYLEKALSIEVEGDFVAGLYRVGSLKICNNSYIPLIIEALDCEDGGCRVIGEAPFTLQPKSCESLQISLGTPIAGNVPVSFSFKVRIPELEAVELSMLKLIEVQPAAPLTGVGSSLQPITMQKPPGDMGVGDEELVGAGIDLDFESLRITRGLSVGFGCAGPGRFPRYLGGLFEGADWLRGSWNCCVLGCGGWGCAYKCSKGGKDIVVKVYREYRGWFEGGADETLHSGLPSGEVRDVAPRWLKGYLRRVETVWGLMKPGHPGIVRLLAYSRIAPMLVYEYANNGSLQWQLSTGWEPDLHDVLTIGVILADALRYIHSRGVVHGDIKPGNIFFLNGTPKLGDFSSVTTLLTSETQTDAAFSEHYTMGWRAPEQVYNELRVKARARALENRVDVYQLGELLLYLLTGEVVDGEEASERLDEALSLVEDNRVRAVLRGMMAVDPVERLSSEEATRRLARLIRTL